MRLCSVIHVAHGHLDHELTVGLLSSRVQVTVEHPADRVHLSDVLGSGVTGDVALADLSGFLVFNVQVVALRDHADYLVSVKVVDLLVQGPFGIHRAVALPGLLAFLAVEADGLLQEHVLCQHSLGQARRCQSYLLEFLHQLVVVLIGEAAFLSKLVGLILVKHSVCLCVCVCVRVCLRGTGSLSEGVPLSSVLGERVSR